MQFAPDAARIEALARTALARIPEPFAEHLKDVVLLVEELMAALLAQSALLRALPERRYRLAERSAAASK